jgi:hypothetical protein
MGYIRFLGMLCVIAGISLGVPGRSAGEAAGIDDELRAAEKRVADLKAKKEASTPVAVAEAVAVDKARIRDLEERVLKLESDLKMLWNAQKTRPVAARETTRNPDKYPSLGLAIGKVLNGKGTSTLECATCHPSTADHSFTTDGMAFGIDFKAPVSDAATIFGGITWANSTFDAPETADFLGQRQEASSMAISGGVRFYFTGEGRFSNSGSN